MANINITMNQADQNAICETCPLPDCVGRDCRECPIQAEQRRRWRASYYQRKSTGYFDALNARLKAERQARREVINV